MERLVFLDETPAASLTPRLDWCARSICLLAPPPQGHSTTPVAGLRIDNITAPDA